MDHELSGFNKAIALLKRLHFKVVKEDVSRPWGGFYVIDEMQAAQFAKEFFPEENFEKLKIAGKLSPKLLIIAPNKRLSWQYHHRRAEVWKCIDGEVEVVTSFTNEEKNKCRLKAGDKIKLMQGERHRLTGLHKWAIIAEIWQHTDAANPSNEDDIVRLQDDFGR
ncbi:MAG TPA: hypothetical protein VFN30_09195 [Chitinophagaceae bacterium]|nr:hypothetical protein [Chitinophagaceae bacterium]